jgi:hypothetical protein
VCRHYAVYRKGLVEALPLAIAAPGHS